jgi:glycosyltransferase involved in cell wall biosynthesis
MMRVAIVIPALDEEATIADVVRELFAAVRALGDDVICIVCDNGSRDMTSQRAKDAGALVVTEPRRGYGRACLRALKETPDDVDIVVFADADGADDPQDVAALLEPLRRNADMVIGSRELGVRGGLVEKGALTTPQRAGNRLATTLLWLAYKQHATDLGPFRAINKRALDALRMDDEGFGWTIQMQARAARLGLRTVEVPVRYRRRRHGRSKVSGNLKASVQAGVIILATLARELHFRRGASPRPTGDLR